MSFTPTIPIGGLAGWRFLERTEASQRAAFEKGAQLAREVAYFEERIAGVTSAEALVKDRRLLKVALGAFGLDDEIDKKAFLRKVLESDPADQGSFAMRLSAPGFRKLAEAFGFGSAAGARTGKAGFAEAIVAAYKARQFEVAVGGVNDAMRLAMNFRREIAELAGTATEDGKGWYSVLGSKPMREVMQGAFGLPKEFAAVDIDRQRETLRDRTRDLLGDGSLAVFRDPEQVERVVSRFLARRQLEEGLAGASSPVLTLLQTAGSSAGLLNLLAAR
jgi:hypothetical protein